MSTYTGLEIAIIGMAGRFPGAADVHAFWNNLAAGVESVRFFTDEELREDGEDERLINTPGYVKANGLLEDKDCFDAAFFNYRPDEAGIMTPQMRVFHECVWAALEDAGCNPDETPYKIGMFAGASPDINWELYAQLMNRDGKVDDFTLSLLSNPKFIATKLSYDLNLKGPSVFLDTACSTSLVAVHMACKSLLLGECGMAVAGGVTVTNRPRRGYLYQEGMIYSKDGHCRTFDDAASGTVAGEGAGVVVLKTLKNALKDGDNIWAVIKGSGINNDGAGKVGYTAPSVKGQIEAIMMAQKWAKTAPETISYIEAHGTATKLGDPVEMEALNAVFGKSEAKYCAVGSVKTNIGHLDTAAGIAGLIKVVLSLRYRQLPPSLHFQTPNREIGFTGTPFYVNTALREWRNDQYPLRAGVSSFGIGGTNAHLILEEAPQAPDVADGRKSHLLMLSAKTKPALERAAANLKAFLEQNSDASLADLAYTLQTGRKSFRYRKYVVSETFSEAIAQLAKAPVEDSESATRTQHYRKVFMFPGQGSQYINMCRELYTSEPVFREETDKAFAIVEKISGRQLYPVVFPEDGADTTAIDETACTQPLLFIVEYALARLLITWGILPDLMIGHSVGEYVAACISGVFSLEDALWLVVKRGELMQKAPRGKMLAVSMGRKALENLLPHYKNISLAAVNSSSLCVVAGTEAAISEFGAVLNAEGYASRLLRTSHAFHSYLMDSVLDEFHQVVARVQMHPQQIPFISNLTGLPAADAMICTPGYWVNHLRHTVLFADGIATILQQEHTVLIEAGPGKTLGSFVQSGKAQNATHKVCQLTRHPREDTGDLHRLLAGIGQLWQWGIVPDWQQFYQGQVRRKISLPTYSFEKTKFPVYVDASRMLSEMTADRALQKDADMSRWFYTPSWTIAPPVQCPRPVKETGYTLLLADECGVGEALASGYKAAGEKIICVTAGDAFYQHTDDAYTIDPSCRAHFDQLLTALAKSHRLPHCIVYCWGIQEPVSQTVSAAVLSRCCYGLLELAKSCQAYGERAPQFVVITHKMYYILDAAGPAGLQVLAPALLKVLSQETPGMRASHIDIDLEDLLRADFATFLQREIQTAERGAVTCFRHGKRWRQTFERITPPHAHAFRQEGVYLITGGLGNLGFVIADYLLRTHNARVMLLGRTGLLTATSDNLRPAQVEKLQRLRRLEKHTAGKVAYLSCNVADPARLAAAVKECEARFGALHGVIHAAGITGGSSVSPASELTAADFDAQFEPKIKGVQALKEVLEGKQVDFCLIISSLSAVLGGIGFGAYAPANAFMDHFISSHKAQEKLENWINVSLDGLELESATADLIGKEEVMAVLERIPAMKELPGVLVSASDLYARLDRWIYGNRPENQQPALQPALPAYEASLPVTAAAPGVATQALTALWQQFFDREITAEDDFFEIGGDSLKALTMIGRLRSAFHVEISVRDFFHHSTVEKMAALIAATAAVHNDEASTYAPVAPSPRKDWYPLSAVQQRQHFLYEFDRSSLAYNLSQMIRIKGPVDKEKFNRVINRIVARHEILRTYVGFEEGTAVQKITDAVHIPLDHIMATEDELPEVIKGFVRPFDLHSGPLLRIALVEISTDEFLLMIDMHHFISDGVSFNIFLKEFMTLYNGQELAEVKLQYRDYAVWQRTEARRQLLEQHRHWWLEEFAEEAAALDLPLDYSRPLVRNYKGATIEFDLGEQETQQLREIAEAEGATLFMVLLAVYSVLLGKLSGQEDVVIGTPTSGRDHADLESIMGMFVNTVAIRTFPREEMSFRTLLREVRSKALNVFDRQAYPYESLIDELKLARDTSRNPLFDVWFVYQNFNDTLLELPDLRLSPYPAGSAISQFDLSLTAGELNGRLHLNFEYSTELFSRNTIERFITYLRRIVNAVCANADDRIASIALVQGAERELLLNTFNDTVKHIEREKTFFALFMEQMLRTPEHIAVEHRHLSLNYHELYGRAARLGQYLAAKGIKAGSRVALYMPRGIDMLTAILGTFRAGAAYVPVETDYPLQRVLEIITDSNAEVVLVNRQSLSLADDPGLSAEICNVEDVVQTDQGTAIPEPAKADDIAYIIYTSGTTGRPKGVMVHQLGMLNHIYAMIEALQLGEGDVIAQMASCSFDISVWQFLCALLTGGRTCIIDKDIVQDPGRLLKEIREKQVTIAEMVPSLLGSLLDEALLSGAPQRLPLRWVIPTAELITPALAARWYGAYPDVRLINAYGPAEASDDVTLYLIRPDDDRPVIPIGKPVGNIRIYILDRYRNLCPVGVVGEICIAGVGVGKGYWQDNEKTARAFIPNPFITDANPWSADYSVLYCTGDMGYYLPDGNIVFNGRRDHQVKIRGHRIELSEVENHLLQHGQLKEVAVLDREKNGSRFLAAYYVAGQALSADDLRTYLMSRLPEYMVPSFFVWMEKMPRTVNGKLDRKALPAPEVSRTEMQEMPVTSSEQLLADIWCKVLEIQTVSVTDNFFAIGGDSIKSTQIVSRLRSAGYEISVKDIFICQNIRELANRVRPVVSVRDQSPVTGTAILTPVQRLFFEGPVTRKHHYNQSVLLNFPAGISVDVVKKIFIRIQEHHDALRMVLRHNGDGDIMMENRGVDMELWCREYDFRGTPEPAAALLAACNSVQAGIDLQSGPLMRLALSHMPDGSRLLIVIHHLVVDGISWRILLEDIASLYDRLQKNEVPGLPPKTDAFLNWPSRLSEYIRTESYQKAKCYWALPAPGKTVPIRRDHNTEQGTLAHAAIETIRLDHATTAALITTAHHRFGTRINDLLLTALLLAVRRQYGNNILRLDLEGHGREELVPGTDISRTVGWFTSIFPVTLEVAGEDLGTTIKAVKETLRAIPNNGIDYGIWRFMDPEAHVPPEHETHPQIIFNYLGQFDEDNGGPLYAMAPESSGDEQHGEEILEYELEISGHIANGTLELNLRFSREQYYPETIRSLMHACKDYLEQITACCCAENIRELTPSDLTYKALTVEQLDALQKRYAVADVYPLSPMQEGIFFHTLYDEHGRYYFEQLTCRVEGTLNIEAVEQAMNVIIDRYSVLRTAFVHEGLDRPLQVVLQARKVDFAYIDVSTECREKGKEAVIRSYQLQDKSRKFNLEKDVLMRLTILQLSDEACAFIWSYHHILMDGWCMSLIIDDFRKLYHACSSGGKAALPPVKPYSEYISWLVSRNTSASVGYWRQYLSGYDSPVTLRAAAKVSTAATAAPPGMLVQELLIAPGVTGQLKNMSIKYGVTINTILQLAWALMLGRYNNTSDVVFGAVVSGRPAEVAGIESMVGLFINTIPVRVTWTAEDTVPGLLRKLQETALNGEVHHFHSLAEIQALSEPGRELLDHILVFENYPISSAIQGGGLQAGGLAITGVTVDVQTNYDLAVVIMPGDTICINFKYNPQIYDTAAVGRLAAHLEQIITGLANDWARPAADLEMITEAEKAWLVQLNEAVLRYSNEKTFIHMFEEQVAQRPLHDAVVYGDDRITYRELSERSTEMAGRIRQRPYAGELVAVYVSPSVEMMIALLGVLKAGKAFLPLDPGQHTGRQAEVLLESRAGLLLTTEDLQHDLHFDGEKLMIHRQLPAGTTNEDCLPARPECPAYVIYTSGSTGRPKGVKIRHRNLANYVRWFTQMLPLTPGDQSVLTSSYAFDLGYSSIFPVLAGGGTLHLVSPSCYRSPEELLQYVADNHITYLKLTPTLFSAIVEAPAFGRCPLPALRHILLGGEPIVPADIEKAMKYYGHIQYINHYGPTETTIGVVAQRITDPSFFRRPTIGRPAGNTKIFIVDRQLKIQPPGIPGELCVAGDSVGEGYLHQEALTEEKFVSIHSLTTGKVYRTGDLATILPDGNIELLGRIDHQVKIRGFRVETGEIENRLTGFQEIKQAVVGLLEKGGSKQLVAWYVADNEIEHWRLKDYLAARLPDHMVPVAYVRIDKLPLTGSGKIDRKALPDPGVRPEGSYVAPRTRTEQTLAGIWAGLLQIDAVTISVKDDFFELGGHSVTAVRLNYRIQGLFAVRPGIQQIFHTPTIEQLARIVDTLRKEEAIMIRRREKMDYYPASSAQERIFYEHTLVKDNLTYNNCKVYRMSGKPDLERLQQSIRLLVSRHEGLRTAFLLTPGGLVQRVNDTADVEIVDLSAGYQTVDDAFRGFVRPFDLQAGNLVRCGVLQLNDEENFLFVDIHHIVCDGVSRDILMNDFKAFYKGATPAPLALRYTDYACWQRQRHGSLKQQQEFWRKKLANKPEGASWLIARNGGVPDMQVAGCYRMELGGHLRTAASRLARASGVSDFMLLLSVYYILLSKVSGGTDITIGTESLGRPQERLLDVVGTFVNLLPLRLQFDENTPYAELLQMVRNVVLEAFEHQDYQYEDMVSMLRADGNTVPALIDAHFSLITARPATIEPDDLDFVPCEDLWIATTDHPLSLQIAEEGDCWNLYFIYNKALYEAEEIGLLAAYYKNITEAVLENGSIHINGIKPEVAIS